MRTHTYHLGIDPGWKNLGVALIKQSVDKTVAPVAVGTTVMNPSSYKNIAEFINKLDAVIDDHDVTLDTVTIERYVAYQNVQSAETENITMVIGALHYYFNFQWAIDPRMVRAIDWKTALVKALFKKKGFNNPSTSLDKKFSIAAADSCMGKVLALKTDHEADAICLAALPLYVP